MAIDLISKYVPLLDNKYAAESMTSLLDSGDEVLLETADPASILIPKMTLSGLGNYSRSGGYASGDVGLTWQNFTFSQDRGRIFTVDAFDNAETAMVAFGRLAGEFISTRVAPEVDAYRFAKYCTGAEKGGQLVAGTLSADSVLEAIDTAVAALDDQEVPEEDRILFVSAETYALMKKNEGFACTVAEDENGRRARYYDGMRLVKVPQHRFQTAITLLDGTTEGELQGGYAAGDAAADINFLLIHKNAVFQITKTASIKVITPEQNPDADAYKFGYRLYHDVFVPENKACGIYAHHKA